MSVLMPRALTLEITKGRHSHNIPDGLDEMLLDVMSRAGLDGHYTVIMGAAIKGRPHLKKVVVCRKTVSAIEVKAQPGDNKTRRVCLIPLEGNNPDKMYESLQQACIDLYGKFSQIEEVEEEEELEEDPAPDALSEDANMERQALEGESMAAQAGLVETSSGKRPPVYSEEETQELTEMEREEYTKRVENTLLDPHDRAVVLLEIEKTMDGRQDISNKEMYPIIRLVADLEKSHAEFPRMLVLGLVGRDLLEALKFDGNQRVSAYRVTRKGLEEIERELGVVPLHLAALREKEARNTPPAPSLEAPGPLHLLAMLSAYQQRVEAAKQARADLNEIEPLRLLKVNEIKRLEVEVCQMEKRQIELRQIADDPEIPELERFLKEAQKMLSTIGQ